MNTFICQLDIWIRHQYNEYIEHAKEPYYAGDAILLHIPNFVYAISRK